MSDFGPTDGFAENRRPAHRGAGEEFRHSNRIRPNVQKVIHAHVSALRLRRAAASQGAADPKADWQRGAAQSARGGRLAPRPASWPWLVRPRLRPTPYSLPPTPEAAAPAP